MGKYLIFISVGTQLPFDRMIKKVEKEFFGKDEFELVYQVGIGGHKPSSGLVFEKLNKRDYERYVERCDVMITHCGTGSLVSALVHKKPIFCMPRLLQNAEHRNDHQLHASNKLNPSVFVVFDNEFDLRGAIKNLVLKGGGNKEIDIINKTFVDRLDSCINELGIK